MAHTTTAGTVVGAFADAAQAQRAVNALKQAGYREDQIGVVSQHADGSTASVAKGDKVEEGAMAGAATGAGLGALWGLGILAGVIPGIGTAIAGGTLGVLLSSAAAGAAAAGIGGALAGMGVSDDDAKYYEGEYRAGRTIVTVNSPNPTEAQRILTQHGGYDRTTVTH